METNKYILQGGGEHARVVLDCLLDMGADVRALFDPKYQGDLFGVPQRGAYDPEFEPQALAIVAIGNNMIRKKVVTKTRHAFGNAIHRSALVSTRASIGNGCMILQRSIVQASASIGSHVILNTGCQIDHDCRIDDFVHIGPGACLCGVVTVGEGTLVGASAVIVPGIHVGKWVTIGAGSVVIRDIPDGSRVAGIPAKSI